MPVSFYDETGVWGYMVNPDHKDFNAIRQALNVDTDEEYFFISSKNVLFSYIYEIYPYHDLYYEKVITFSDDEKDNQLALNSWNISLFFAILLTMAI